MIVAVSPATEEARELIRELDTEIAARYPGLRINGIDAAKFESGGGYFVIARVTGHAVGCGAFRPVGDRRTEIKRMFVKASARRRGIARQSCGMKKRFVAAAFNRLCLRPGAISRRRWHCMKRRAIPIPAFLGYVGSPISGCYAKKAWAYVAHTRPDRCL